MKASKILSKRSESVWKTMPQDESRNISVSLVDNKQPFMTESVPQIAVEVVQPA